MIIGIGSDITNINRFENLYKKYEDKFISRILTPFELIQFTKRKNYQSKLGFLAKRFAAKEAFVKAIGTGFTSQITMQDIYTFRDRNGRPGIEVSSKLHDFMIAKYGDKKFNIHLSLSDDFPNALAFVVIDY